MPQASDRLLATPKIKPRLPCIRPLAMGRPPRSGAGDPYRTRPFMQQAAGIIGAPLAFSSARYHNGCADIVRGAPCLQSVVASKSLIPALRRFARALARDAETADDLVQDTLVRALRGEHLFHGGDLRTWTFTILLNLDRNRRRGLARRPNFAVIEDVDPAGPPGTDGTGRDIAARSRPLAAGAAGSFVARDARRTELPRGRRSAGCADRHRDVAFVARTHRLAHAFGGRAAAAAPSEVIK